MERTDPASSEDVKRMVHELGTTIQRTLAESPQIAHCLNRIKAEGYEVSLVLEATIGFSKSGSRESEVSTFDFKVEIGRASCREGVERRVGVGVLLHRVLR